MDRDQDNMVSNAEPRGTILPATVIEPVISGVTQRTRHEIVYIVTSTQTAGENMRDV